MSFHPNDVARRARVANGIAALVILWLASAFFRAQVLDSAQYRLSSERNRLREVPIPAARGVIYDRRGQIIAENVPGYSVSVLSVREDSLRATLARLSDVIALSPGMIEAAVGRLRREPNRPTVILSDATFDQVSVLEEHRMEFPSLIIQSAPKRYYPDGPAVAAFAGYTGQISERELALPRYESYKGGQEIGKGGLEQQYELELRGQEGSRFVEVDARGRVVREQGARDDLLPVAGKALQTNIDLDLQRYVAALLGDSVVAGVVAMEPATGAILALHSSPAFDPNRFIGGIPTSYWRELSDDPRRPMYNKALQGRYPPASTFKLATAALALQEGIADFDTRMERPCTGGYMYGRYWKCWKREGHGSVNMTQAIAQSCDTYFYQLGLRLSLSKLLAGGVSLKFAERTGIDLPNEQAPIWPEAVTYFDRIFGAGKWTNGVTLNLSIGQGQNTQTVLNMARFYSALATDGYASTPSVAQHEPVRTQILKLTDEQFAGLRAAMGDVVSGRGTAGSAVIQGVQLAGKTGTAQNETQIDHAWFVGFAPQEAPTIVVAVIVYQGEHGYVAARIASKVISHYLKRPAIVPTLVEGN